MDWAWSAYKGMRAINDGYDAAAKVYPEAEKAVKRVARAGKKVGSAVKKGYYKFRDIGDGIVGITPEMRQWYDENHNYLGQYIGNRGKESAFRRSRRSFRSVARSANGMRRMRAYRRNRSRLGRRRRPRRRVSRRVFRVRKRRFPSRIVSRIAKRAIHRWADWGYGEPFSILTPESWNSTINAKKNNNYLVNTRTILQNYFDNCIPITTTGTTITWADITSEDVTMKLHKSHVTVTLCNNYSYTVNIDFFWMKCKSDTGTRASAMMNAAFDTYLVDSANPPVAITTGEEYVGWSYKNILHKVRHYWRLRSRKRVVIEPTKTVTLTFPIDKVFTNSRYLDLGAGVDYLKNMSYELVMQQWGQVAHDVMDDELVGISDSQIDAVVKYVTTMSAKRPRQLRRGHVQQYGLDEINVAEVIIPAVDKEDQIPPDGS